MLLLVYKFKDFKTMFKCWDIFATNICLDYKKRTIFMPGKYFTLVKLSNVFYYEKKKKETVLYDIIEKQQQHTDIIISFVNLELIYYFGNLLNISRQ